MRALICLIWAVAVVGGAWAGDVTALSNDWAAAWSAKKLGDMLDLYAPDPVFLPASGERWEGKDGIAANFWAGLTQFNPALKLKSRQSEVSGDLAYDSGIYDETVTPVRDGQVMHTHGNYLFVFKRQPDGQWKILQQTFTQFDAGKL